MRISWKTIGVSSQFLNMPESIRQLIGVRKRQIQKELKDE